MSPYEKLGTLLLTVFIAFQNNVEVLGSTNNLLMEDVFQPYVTNGNFQQTQFQSFNEPTVIYRSWSENEPVQMVTKWSSEAPRVKSWSTGGPSKTMSSWSTNEPFPLIGGPNKVKFWSAGDPLNNDQSKSSSSGKYTAKSRSPDFNAKKLSYAKFSSDDSEPENNEFQKWSAVQTDDTSSISLPPSTSGSQSWSDDAEDYSNALSAVTQIDKQLMALARRKPSGSSKSWSNPLREDFSFSAYKTFLKSLPKNKLNSFSNDDDDDALLNIHRSQDSSQSFDTTIDKDIDSFDNEFLKSFQTWSKNRKPSTTSSSTALLPSVTDRMKKYSITKYSSSDDQEENYDEFDPRLSGVQVPTFSWPSNKNSQFSVNNNQMNGNYPTDNYKNQQAFFGNWNGSGGQSRQKRPSSNQRGRKIYSPAPGYPGLINRIGMIFGR